MGEVPSGFSPAIVFTDLDGTFLARDKTVPEINLEVAHLLAARGIPLVPCTGRPISGLTPVVLELPGIRYVVYANGAGIWDLEAGGPGAEAAFGRHIPGACIHKVALSREAILDAYRELKDLDITFDLFADGRAYSERRRFERLGDFGLEPNLLHQIRLSRTPVDATVPELLERVEEPERITLYYRTPEDRARIRATLEADPRLVVTSSEVSNLEASALGATKGCALRWLCARLDISPACAIAFGDGMNDVSMMEAAGLGVALADSQPGVAALADDVTRLGCSEGGLGAYLLEAMCA